MGQVIQFPCRVSLEAEIRKCQRMVDRQREIIDNYDERTADIKERVAATIAPQSLEDWLGDLRLAKSALASLDACDVITYNGVAYAHTAGRA